MKGVVKRKTEKGFGFILGEDGKEYFFHGSALRNVKYDGVKQGDQVEFEPSEGAKGPRVEDVYV